MNAFRFSLQRVFDVRLSISELGSGASGQSHSDYYHMRMRSETRLDFKRAILDPDVGWKLTRRFLSDLGYLQFKSLR